MNWGVELITHWKLETLSINILSYLSVYALLQDKSKFVTYVVAPGLTYGAGENLFHFLFKVSTFGVGSPGLPS